jgi:hypothetical protein
MFLGWFPWYRDDLNGPWDGPWDGLDVLRNSKAYTAVGLPSPFWLFFKKVVPNDAGGTCPK